MKSAWNALKFLTLAGRFGTVPVAPEEIGAAAAYFPVVGAMLGLTLILLHRVVEPFLESEIEAAVLVLALIIMTAALHLEGTQKTFDQLLSLNEGNAVTVYGIVALILVITLKIRSIEVMGETRNVNLLLAPVMARWGLVIFLYGPVRAGDEPASRIARGVSIWHIVIASLATLVWAVYFTGRVGLWVCLCVSLLALLGRSYFHKRRAGFNYDNLGAIVEVGETLGFVLLASL